MTRWSRGRAATCLLTCFVPGDDAEMIVGDLEEECGLRMASRLRLPIWYWAQIVTSLPAILWLPIRRGGQFSTFALALAACVAQVTIEVTTGLAIVRFLPPHELWVEVMAAIVTLSSLVFLTYLAARIRAGAATAIALLAVVALLGRFAAAESGRDALIGILVSLFAVPAAALAGGFLSSNRRPHNRAGTRSGLPGTEVGPTSAVR